MSGPREILIECVQVGGAVRVSAIDSETGTEINFQAPANTSQLAIKRLAATKIRYVLEKKKQP